MTLKVKIIELPYFSPKIIKLKRCKAFQTSVYCKQMCGGNTSLEAFPFRLIQMAPLDNIDEQIDVHMAHWLPLKLPTNGLLAADNSAH